MNIKNSCPYSKLPEKSFFRNIVEFNGDLEIARANDDLIIQPCSVVVSAGSCFAARVARALTSNTKINYLRLPDLLTDEPSLIKIESDHLFSLRDGNIYTVKHFRQIIERALGIKKIRVPLVRDSAGRVRNMLRPSVLSYDSESTALLDEASHLKNWISAIEAASHFIFTLGLTEQWVDSPTGLSLPVAPGCGFGEFDSRRHTFLNSSILDVHDDLEVVLSLLSSINKNLRVILTVSPVPLVATFENRSAVEATIYSKSALLQAAYLSVNKQSKLSTTYFPSFELISNPFFLSRNFHGNMRDVTEEGVEVVMRGFYKMFGIDVDRMVRSDNESINFQFHRDSVHDVVADPICDEDNLYAAYLDRPMRPY